MRLQNVLHDDNAHPSIRAAGRSPMTTLRVLVDAVPAPGRAFGYALVDAAGRVAARGRGEPSQWPRADTRVAIVDAPLVHVAALKLPPIQPARLADAVRFALDDQLAAATDSMHIAHGAQAKDGRVQAIALARDLMRAIDERMPGFARIVALPSLLPARADWQWAYDRDGRGFLLRPDASAFAVAASSGAPAEIALAVSQAQRAGRGPARIVAHGPDARSALPSPQIGGVRVESGPSWAWDGTGALAADVAAAPDLRQGAFTAAGQRDGAADARRRWRPALALTLAAVAFSALAGAGTWAYDGIDAWRDERAAISLARDIGQPAQDFAGAIAAISLRYAEARHVAGLAAPDDALPLLARAAPALAALPPGKWKRATYGGGAWTFEFGALDDVARDALLARLSAAGITALAANNPGGVRVRIQA
jgi:Type II secretion system (T2SS), protein L